MKEGFLYVLMGPMCAGKTSELIHHIRVLEKKNIKTKVYKHSNDTRYDDGTELCSHDQMREPCTSISLATEIDNIDEYQVIVIEEGQFFGKEILDVVENLVNVQKKYVIVGGLSGNASMKPMGYMNDMISMADEVKLLTALCHYCDDCVKAPFTVKISGTNSEVEVGTDMYKPVCRYHFLEHYGDIKQNL